MRSVDVFQKVTKLLGEWKYLEGKVKKYSKRIKAIKKELKELGV